MKTLGTFKYSCPWDHKTITLEIQQGYYSFGGNYTDGNRVAIELLSNEDGPYSTFTVNVPEIRLETNEFILNHDNHPKLEEAMMKTGLFEDTGKRANYGFVTGRPVWILK